MGRCTGRHDITDTVGKDVKHHTTDHSINQSINQSVNQSVNQSTHLIKVNESHPVKSGFIVFAKRIDTGQPARTA